MTLLEKITAAGGKLWRKGNQARFYFSNLEELYGLRTNNYKSGNVRSATLNGEKISNSRAHDIINMLRGKQVYIDAMKGELTIVSDLDGESHAIIEAAIRKSVS